MLGAQAASAAEPDATHSSKTAKLVGHAPTKTRATLAKDRADAPQHRAAPWTPLAVEPVGPAVGPQHESAEAALVPASPRLDYDAPAPQGRAPPQ